MTLPAPIEPRPTGLATHFDNLDETARQLARRRRAPHTLAAYDRDWDYFAKWCTEASLTPFPADPLTVARYIAALHQAGRKPSTIGRYIASISVRHQAFGVPNPAADQNVRDVLSGLRNSSDNRPDKKEPMTTDLLIRMFAGFDPANPTDQRDRAILLVSYAAVLRRSETVGINVEHITVSSEGMAVHIPSSKTDQQHKGADVGVLFGNSETTCPVRAWTTWRITLAAAGFTAGPAFRDVTPKGKIAITRLSDRTVANIVKRRVAVVGLEPADFGGHSSRRGAATAAAKAGASDRAIMRQGRWKSRATVDGYVAAGRLFEDNVSGMLGL